MKLSQAYRTGLIAIAGFLLTAMFHTGAAAQTKSPQGVRNIVIVHGAWAVVSLRLKCRFFPVAMSQQMSRR